MAPNYSKRLMRLNKKLNKAIVKDKDCAQVDFQFDGEISQNRNQPLEKI